MSFTSKPTKKNVRWIERNIEKDAQKVESATLDRWTTEGGFVAEETKAKLKKKVFVYRKHRLLLPQHINRRLFRQKNSPPAVRFEGTKEYDDNSADYTCYHRGTTYITTA